MPFNSNHNDVSSSVNFHELRNSYNYHPSEDYTEVLQPTFYYREPTKNMDAILPAHTSVIPYLNQAELQQINGDYQVGGGFGSFLKSGAKSLANKAKEKAKEKLREKGNELKERAKQEAKKQAYKAFDYTTDKAKDYLTRKQQEYEMAGADNYEYDAQGLAENCFDDEMEGAGFGSFIKSISQSAKKNRKIIIKR